MTDLSSEQVLVVGSEMEVCMLFVRRHDDEVPADSNVHAHECDWCDCVLSSHASSMQAGLSGFRGVQEMRQQLPPEFQDDPRVLGSYILAVLPYGQLDHAQQVSRRLPATGYMSQGT